MPRSFKGHFGEVPGWKIGSKIDTLHELDKSTIHEKGSDWRITKDGVPSLVLRLKDLDEGDQLIIVFEPKLTFKAKELKAVTAFKKNLQNNLPIRVVRPYILGGQYAPLTGYRYDGLYKVTEIKSSPSLEKGVIQFFIHLRLLPDQRDLVPWERAPKQPPSQDKKTEMKMEETENNNVLLEKENICVLVEDDDAESPETIIDVEDAS